MLELTQIRQMPPDEKDQAVEELLADCFIDTSIYSRTFFSHACFRPFDRIHDQIFEMLDDSSVIKGAIAVPRGLGKTTIGTVIYPSKSVVYHTANYIVPVGASAAMAWEQGENLKDELVGNALLKEVFGVSKTRKFGKERWIVRVGGANGHEVCVFPRGAGGPKGGQKVRGMKWKIHRPNLILVDDLEDPDHIDSEEQREKKEEWFFNSLCNCVDRGASNWRIIVIGTVLHQDSLLVKLLDSPHWDSVSIPIADEGLTISYAPHFMDVKAIKELRQEAIDNDNLDGFHREYMNEAAPTGKHATFQQSFFKYYDPLRTNFSGSEWRTVVLVDPAKKTTKRSVQSAVVGVSFNQDTGGIYVRDVVAGKLHIDANEANEGEQYGGLIRETIDMVRRIGATAVGVETAGLGEFGLYPFQTQFFKEKLHVEVIELKAKGGHDEKGKVKRIRSLVPFYRGGLMFHNQAVCAGLEKQLMSFPRSALWDIMDALSYVIQVFDLAELHALGEGNEIAKAPRDVMYSDDEDLFFEEYNETAREIEREFRELAREYDEPFRGWRARDAWAA